MLARARPPARRACGPHPRTAGHSPARALYDGKLPTLQRGELRAGLDIPLLRDGPIDRPRAELQKAALADDQARAELRQRERELQQYAAYAYWDGVAAGNRLTVRERRSRSAPRCRYLKAIELGEDPGDLSTLAD